MARAMRDALGPNVTILPTIGNNDVYPHNSLASGPNSCLAQIAQAWVPIVPPQAIEAFRANGSFAYLVRGAPILVISLNTIYLADLNDEVHACDHESSPGAALMTWLAGQVAEAERNRLKVVVIGHVPPTTQWYGSCREAYAEIVEQHVDTFAAHFFAHRHYDSFTILYSDGSVGIPPGTPIKSSSPGPARFQRLRGSGAEGGEGAFGATKSALGSKNGPTPVASALIAPSVLPEFNSALRVAEFASDGSFADYKQYYYDLDTSNEQQTMTLQLEYSARQAFPALALHGLGPNGWAELLEDISTNANVQALYSRYAAVSWAGANVHARGHA